MTPRMRATTSHPWLTSNARSCQRRNPCLRMPAARFMPDSRRTLRAVYAALTDSCTHFRSGAAEAASRSHHGRIRHTGRRPTATKVVTVPVETLSGAFIGLDGGRYRWIRPRPAIPSLVSEKQASAVAVGSGGSQGASLFSRLRRVGYHRDRGGTVGRLRVRRYRARTR